MVSDPAEERLQQADRHHQEHVESDKKPKAATWLRSTHARAVPILAILRSGDRCAFINL